MTIDISLRHQFAGFDLEADFAISQPGITALFGPSGSGKSTIINAIAGLIRPQSGHITINDRPVFDSNRHIFLLPRKRRVGYVFQDARLFPHLSVRKNLMFAHRRSKSPLPADQTQAVIEMLGIEGLLDRRPNRLSGGEKQRIALGRALLGNPDILLLDEPLSALDQARKDEILPYLEMLRDARRLPILYVSHAIDEVARLADHLVVIEGGKTRASGSIFDVLGRSDLAPLTGQFDTGTVLPARVISRDPTATVSFLSCSGHRLVVPYLGRALGQETRLHIRARDVMIARRAPTGISANNILPVTISAIDRSDKGDCELHLRLEGLGDHPDRQITARITAWSANRLHLAEGQDVFAVIKSVTVDGHLRHETA
jgi:molybdate transport system ATP-binding protein